MNRVIEIKNCQDCPHFSNTGNYTEGGAKPCCNHPTDFCPLESVEDFCESNFKI